MNSKITILFSVLVVVLFLVTSCARYQTITPEDLKQESNNVSQETNNPTSVAEEGEEVAVNETTTNEAVNEAEQIINETTESTNETNEALENITNEVVNETEQITNETTEITNETEVTTTPEENETQNLNDIVFNYTEGDLVDINEKFDISDADNDKLTITYGSPLNDEGKWQTEEGDAGTYKTYVSVSDGKTTVKQKFTIKVKIANNPPVIKNVPEDITVDEGETIKIEPNVTDADGDEVTIRYTGWKASEFKANGEYTTTYTDAGEYNTTLTATDGKEDTTLTIKITVNDVNRPPVLKLK